MAGATATKAKDIVVLWTPASGTAITFEYTGSLNLPATADNTAVRVPTNLQVIKENVANSEWDDYTINLLYVAATETALVTAKQAATAGTLNFKSTVTGATLDKTWNVLVKKVGPGTGGVEGIMETLPVVFTVVSQVTGA